MEIHKRDNKHIVFFEKAVIKIKGFELADKFMRREMLENRQRSKHFKF